MTPAVETQDALHGGKPNARASARRALAKENAGAPDTAPLPTLGVANRFGFRDASGVPTKRAARAPARAPAAAAAKGANDQANAAIDAPLDEPAALLAPIAAAPQGGAGAPDDGAIAGSSERRRSGVGLVIRRRRSSVRTPLRPGDLITVDENGQLPAGIDSPPPTPIDIASSVANAFRSEVDEANVLVGHKVRAKKFDYKGIIQQQSELIVQLKRCLSTMVEKSSEAREKSLAAQELANSKVQSLALAKKPMREQIAGLSAQLESLKGVHTETASARAELQARYDALVVISDSDKAALHAAAARVELTEDELAAEKERAGGAEKALAAVRRQLDTTEKQVSELAEKLRVSGVEHEKQLDTLRESIERRTDRQRTEHDAIASELRARGESAASEAQRLAADLSECAAERDELRTRAGALADARTRLEAETADATSALRTTRAELAKKEADLSESLRNISRMQTEAIERQAELRDEKKELAERLERASERAERLDDASARGAKECALLEAELRAVDASDARATRALAEAEAARLEAMELLLSAQSELTTLRQGHAQLDARARDAVAERDGARAQLASSSEREAALRAELSTRLSEARDLEVEFRTYKAHCGSSNMEQMGALVRLQRECEALNARFEETRGQLGVREGETQSLQAEVANRARYVAELESKLLDAEETRRKLHNTVQELKGNIRVFCRVRPPNGATATDDCLALRPDGESVHLTTVSAGEKSARESSHHFSFDKVFAPGAPQSDVFGEVSALVQSALDGYKVCIFAYGQTGSGKTFTMQGTADERNCGIVPRSLKQIFQATAAARHKGWTYDLRASFVEVYNENVRDLLAPPGAPPGTHSIVHDEAFGTVVTDATRLPVTSEAQVDELAHMAARQRSVGKTDMNSVSSRSHAVFMLYLTGARTLRRARTRARGSSPCAAHARCASIARRTRAGTNPSVGHALHGALHLVDLAGSERLSRSNATGATLKETQAINKSLSALGDVFASLTAKASHVPFRNSKLTYLMAPCLSGDGKTLMVVNVAPEVRAARPSAALPSGARRAPANSTLPCAELSSLRHASRRARSAARRAGGQWGRVAQLASLREPGERVRDRPTKALGGACRRHQPARRAVAA